MSDYIVSDTSLTSVANAIRSKTGKSATMTYPTGFVSEIENISGWTINNIVVNNFLSGAVTITSNLYEYALDHKGRADTPWTLMWTGSSCSSRALAYTKGLTALVVTYPNYYGNAYIFQSPQLLVLDTAETRFPSSAWASNTLMNTIVLRHASVTTLNNVNAVSSTPFASGGTGGTIYIPKSLYDHLGDGTSSDYKAATNWSTINGYGTITWAKIEGSQYEHYYADGTAIPTT